MVNAALSGARAFGKDGETLVADLREAAGDRDSFGLCALAAIDRDVSVPERRHVGRMVGHDAGFALGARDNDHVDLLGHHQPVGRNKLKVKVCHYCLLSIAWSKLRVAASNLSRQPVLQKPTTLPR